MHRHLTEALDGRRELQAVSGTQRSPTNAPQCFQGRPAIYAPTAADIQTVYTGLRKDFYFIVDQIIHVNTRAKRDPITGAKYYDAPGAIGIAGNPVQLTLQQKQFRFANIVGNAARLVFHDAGEVSIAKTAIDTLGSDGCLSNTAPNSGLQEMGQTITTTIIEDLWQKYCNLISRADFWVLFGKIALEAAIPTSIFSKEGPLPVQAIAGQTIPWLNLPYQFGRPDSATCEAGAGRLPAHQPGLTEFTRVFKNQMGMTLRDGVTLSGAHSVGHVHTQFSGFGHADSLKTLETFNTINSWDETPWMFDNIYYDSLAIEPWLNNDAQLDQISGKQNQDANFWAVQVVAGTPQPVPTCSLPDVLGNTFCGITGGDNIFCKIPTAVNATTFITKRSTSGLTAASVAELAAFANPKDPFNTCNCAAFFQIPQIDAPLNCNMGAHPKTIMLNSDMDQLYNIKTTATVTGVKKGQIGEFCSPAAVSLTTTTTKPLMFPQPVTLPNGAASQQGFGCVKNTKGDLVLGNKQTLNSNVLQPDPNAKSVSLWAQVQSYLTGGIVGACLNGVSTFDAALPKYGGSVKTPLKGFGYIGQNDISLNVGAVKSPNPLQTSISPLGANKANVSSCVPATAPKGGGRDIFYRDFEKAWVKMVTVGFNVDGKPGTQNVKSSKKGNLQSIILTNPFPSQMYIEKNLPGTPTLPYTPAGSSTCVPGEICF